MFRALSTRKSYGKYERLGEEPSIGVLGIEYKRTASLPARIFNSSRKSRPEPAAVEKKQVKPDKKVTKEKSHPLFNIFDLRHKKKMTAKPEFARYIEYLKEGGMWDSKSNMPVIYYK
ncbi:Sodium/potassium-transporting ATPase subunit alpha-1 like [Quillaja saponaria]|uniref:Sodium/potassium-transporting ATPase subunit alpha-1 like n=1 Tax=Quillaja saponaria TaxID=32244 RepID=A0AAD7L7W4_QUISA|nr:Sodium/potassium-transporting ATPase subunit alpha-1 like [Quillaja saponaria]KAJ7953032.1 Sodium/potassium-transporting ATPase subunit alpha-1 like [Quillaja saponaria]